MCTIAFSVYFLLKAKCLIWIFEVLPLIFIDHLSMIGEVLLLEGGDWTTSKMQTKYEKSFGELGDEEGEKRGMQFYWWEKERT